MFILLLAACTKQEVDADILIKNGTVYTGEDATPKTVSIAVKDDKIIYVGKADAVEIVASQNHRCQRFGGLSRLYRPTYPCHNGFGQP